MRILVIVGTVLLGAVLIAVGALGARWLTPQPGTVAPRVVERPGGIATDPSGARTPGELSLESLRALLAIMDEKQRKPILDSADTFAQFIKQETMNQAVLVAAQANGAEENSAIRTLMERAGQRVLAETYLNQIVKTNLDPAFPTEAQVKEAYDKNPDAFRVPERMHLWQIFIELPPGSDEAAIKSAWSLADQLASELRASKEDFAAMAKKHSAHEASRVNDGYMGLLKTADLLPPIAEAVAKLESGQVSEPIASEAGLHVVRRGATVGAEMLDFEKVKVNVREQLLREAAQKVREAAVEKITKEYPVTAPTELESWRTELQKSQVSPVVPPEAKADDPEA